LLCAGLVVFAGGRFAGGFPAGGCLGGDFLATAFWDDTVFVGGAFTAEAGAGA
jgi:hypothetical protein